MNFKQRRMEETLNGALSGGWEKINKTLDPEVARRLSVEQGKEGLDQEAISRAWFEFSITPGGEKAIDALFSSTLWRTIYFVNLGLDPLFMANFGAFREGQMSLAHEIARQIALGQGENVKPRDVT